MEVRGVERFDIVERILGPLERRNPKQCDFLHQLFDEHKKFILYGGAAGGGKSYILRWACILFLLFAWRVYRVRNVRVGLFCEDYPSLRDRQISKITNEVPRYLGRLRETHAEGLIWQMPDDENFGGGFIAPRNLNKPEKYDSTEFAMMAVDELTKNPRETKQNKDIFSELRKRLRWGGVQRFPDGFVFPFVGGTNPGGPGHDWVKELWIDREFPPHLQSVAHQFVLVRAMAKDNQYNPPEYYDDLLTLPDEYRRAYAEGDWDSFMGQFFGKWRRSVHICKPFVIPGYWTRFTAEDWGFAKPWCRLWFAVSPEGRVIAYREQYERRRLPDHMAQEGLRLSEGENIKYRLGDPSMWDEPPGGYGGKETGEPIADQLRKHGWEIQEANNRRVSGWLHVREYLEWEKDKEERFVRAPMFQVMEGTCPNLIRTMPAQIFDKTNHEDLDTDAEDHAPDTLRYGLMSLPKPSIVPLEELPDEWTEAVMRAAHADRRGKRGKGHDLN